MMVLYLVISTACVIGCIAATLLCYMDFVCHFPNFFGNALHLQPFSIM